MQRDWRAVGVTPKGIDQRLWQRFRSHCDQLFAQREVQAAQRADEQRDLLTQAAACLDQFAQQQEILAEQGQSPQNIRTQLAQLEREFEAFNLQALTRGPLANESSTLRERFRALSNSYQQLLQQATTQEKRDTLAQLEQADQALAAIEANQDQTALEVWQQQYGDLKQFTQRISALGSTPDPEAVRTALQRLAITAESQAGIESPAADQALRMEIQVERLNAGLARRQRTDSDEIFSLVALWCAQPSGYMEDNAQAELLRARFFHAIGQMQS